MSAFQALLSWLGNQQNIETLKGLAQCLDEGQESITTLTLILEGILEESQAPYVPQIPQKTNVFLPRNLPLIYSDEFYKLAYSFYLKDKH